MSLSLLLRKNQQLLIKGVEHKFYSRIISGRLPHAQLAVYLAQDNIYLGVCAFVLEQLARSANTRNAAQVLTRHSRDALTLMTRQRRFTVKVLQHHPALTEAAR